MAKATRKKSKARAKKKSSRSTSAKRRTTKKAAAKKKTTKKRVAKKRVAKKRKIGRKKKAAKKKTTRKKAVKKKTKKKVAKRRPGKKKARKKATGRKTGKKKRRSRKKAAKKAAAAPMSIESTRLSIAVRQAEEAMEKLSDRLANARDRGARAAMTARLKRTEAARAAADSARNAVAAIDARRVGITARLRAARDAFKEQHKGDLASHKRAQALKDALEHYEERFLKAYDRKVARRGKKRRSA